MRFLIVDTDYPEFLDWLYKQHPRLEDRSYDEQMKARTESLFGIAHFYSSNLAKLGHEACDVYANNEFMQIAWGREHEVRIRPEPGSTAGLRRMTPRADRITHRVPSDSKWNLRLRRALPWAAQFGREKWSNRILADILSAQVKQFAPDVVLNQAMDWVGTSLIEKIKPYVRLVIGQIAAPLPPGEDFRCYDLVISSLPNIVDYFRRQGIPSELSRLAFEPTILKRLNGGAEKIDVSFVGSLSSHHSKRVRWLEQLCQRVDLQIWGPSVDSFPTSSPIRHRYRGVAWGFDMYRVLQASKITVNQHTDIAGSYANNLRLFEATGVGTQLVTDLKENLPDLFEPDREVVAYRNSEECAALVEHYLENEDERKAVARAGQTRTLSEHTYENRARGLIETVEGYL